MRTTVVYAPPLIWGPWTKVAEATGRGTFNIRVEKSGNVETLVVGQVKYVVEDWRIEDFRDQITVRNGNSVNGIEVRLKGAPTGVQCVVRSEP